MAVASAGRVTGVARERVMAIIKIGGVNGPNAPHKGEGMTTMGYRAPRPPLCEVCGGHNEGIYTINGNGQQIGPECQSPRDREALQGVCEPEEEPES